MVHFDGSWSSDLGYEEDALTVYWLADCMQIWELSNSSTRAAGFSGISWLLDLRGFKHLDRHRSSDLGVLIMLLGDTCCMQTWDIVNVWTVLGARIWEVWTYFGGERVYFLYVDSGNLEYFDRCESSDLGLVSMLRWVAN